MPRDTSDEPGQDSDDKQANETSESMHRATEQLRRLWARMNKDKNLAAEFEESESESSEKPGKSGAG